MANTKDYSVKLNLFQHIFRFFFTIYSGIMFMIWVFIAFILYLLLTLFTKKKYHKQFLWFLYRVIGKLIVITLFLRVKKKNHGTFSKDESYVVVSNHNTMIDIPANVAGSPEEILFKFLGKKEADRLPFFGTIINAFCILVDRSSKESRKASYTKMKREMNKGFSVFLYIEGTRNRTTAPVKEFYDGAFRLAIEMQKPIVVNTLVGIRQLNPPSSIFTVAPGIISSHWEKPISTIGMTLEDIPKLKEQVKLIMIKRLEKIT